MSPEGAAFTSPEHSKAKTGSPSPQKSNRGANKKDFEYTPMS